MEEHRTEKSLAGHWASLAGWFLGPKAENIDSFCRLADHAFRMHADFRRNRRFPTDQIVINETVKDHQAYKNQETKTEKELHNICRELQNSLPKASLRHQAHHTGDVTMQAFLGYIAGLMYNQNNLAYLLSPATTKMEKIVNDQMCKMVGYGCEDMPCPWGHITADGTISILEAVWSCRNIKFYPLSVKEGLVDKRMSKAIGYTVTVCGKERKKLVDCSQWELLNLDIDEIVEMPQKVLQMAEVDPSTYSAIIDAVNLTNLGVWQFVQKYGISTAPVLLIPASKHYSWPKAAGLLGIGEECIKDIPIDENGRICIRDLEMVLKDCLKNSTPVISVVAVIGSTETSAVDDLVEIIKLREKFRLQGLNFGVNVDAAVGGYFCTMLQPEEETSMDLSLPDENAFVPNFPMSKHTEKQLKALKLADTVACDPHKSGFVAFPAGGLCYRNQAMKSFLKKDADYIIRSESNPEVGRWGVEGSKPGAAAVGILMSHKVIGLDKSGIGRILGQCMFAAKIFYCILLTLADESDNFLCAPMKPPPGDKPEEYYKVFIKKHILGRTTEELCQDPNIMGFLEQIGPDLMITAFAVNKKNNKDPGTCNELNEIIFQKCSSFFYNIRRVQLFLASSKFSKKTQEKPLQQLKRRLGLSSEETKDQTILMHSSMNPWTMVDLKIYELGRILRQTVLDSLGQLYDDKGKHSFICVGLITTDGEMFGDYIPNFKEHQHQYHAVTKVRFLDQHAIQAIRGRQIKEKSVQSDIPIVFRMEEQDTLGNLIEANMHTKKHCSVWAGLPSSENKPILEHSDVLVLDTPRCRHFDTTVKEYPSQMTYFMYGDENGVYLSHNIGKYPSFHQVLTLDEIPQDISLELLQPGINIYIPTMQGTPITDSSGHINDPLQRTLYTIECKTYNGETLRTEISLKKSGAKTYFDGNCINSEQIGF